MKSIRRSLQWVSVIAVALLSSFLLHSTAAQVLDAAYAVTEITLRTTEGEVKLDPATCGSTPSTACLVTTALPIEGVSVALNFPENGVKNVNGNLLGNEFSAQTVADSCRYGDEVCYEGKMAYLNPRAQNGGYFVGKPHALWGPDSTGTIVVNAGGKSQTFYLRGADVGVLDADHAISAVYVKTSANVISPIDISNCGDSAENACTVRTTMPIKGISVALRFPPGSAKNVTAELLGNKYTVQSDGNGCTKGDEVCYDGETAYINPLKQNGGDFLDKDTVPWGADAQGTLVINAGNKKQIIYLNGKSRNANLTNLVLGTGELKTAFAPSVLNYFAEVPNSVASVTVRPTKAQANATIQVNGTDVVSGAVSKPINLSPGGNTIAVSVKAQNGDTRTYYVVVKRAGASAVEIPVMRQKPGSDWINVKTQTQAAVGDGVADDTAAIQAALDSIGNQKPGTNRDPRALLTVYLPAGTYRITKTLTISDIGKVYQGLLGTLIIGDGALTRLVWDGPAGPATSMVVTNGAAYGRFEGIVFDGAKKAGVGLDHASTRTFETEIDHYSLSFHNFLNAGLRIGNSSVASSEAVYHNCVFADCASGIQLLTFNDYDNVITGNEFRNCGRGIVLGYGCNGYIRDNHFEFSSMADIISYGPMHPCSVRRCTSIGSNRFIDWSSSVASLTVQDCQVAGWTSLQGAILLRNTLTPVTLFDCTFTNPPAGTPPLHNEAPTLLISNLNYPGSSRLAEITSGPQYYVPIEIPKGTQGGWLTSATQSFVGEVEMPSAIFDARKYGAVGDGVADDTEAVQATIDAARKNGQGALAYFPSGAYRVTKTIEITGKNYTVAGGGSGFYTDISWSGPDGGVTLHVHDVDGVRLLRMSIGAQSTFSKNSRDILQDGNTPGSMTYENVWVYGTYAHAPTVKGLFVEGAPSGSTIHLRHVSGNIAFNNCSRAHVFVDASWEGAMTVSGAQEKVRDGLFASATRFNSGEPFGVYVKDNQSAVLTDFYSESSDAYLSVSGGDGLPTGRVTVAGIKIDVHVNPAVLIENYKGQVSMIGSQFYDSAYQLIQHGPNATELVLAGNNHTSNPKVEVSLEAGSRLTSIGNYWVGGPPNAVDEDGLNRIAKAMDDFSMLGALDLKVNHPALLPGAFPQKPAN